MDNQIDIAILQDLEDELTRAMKWGNYNSAHEGYGVLLEEMDELWDHVKTNQKNRDLVAMRQEAIQVAACAIKFVTMIDCGMGRK